jgi:hypothetical protein
MTSTATTEAALSTETNGSEGTEQAQIVIDPTQLTGSRRSSTYLAARTQQGGRTVYSLRVPLADLDVILRVPNPEQADPDNRKVNKTHARSFGDYLLNRPGWVSPALLVRDSGGTTFKEIDPNAHVGYLEVPWALGSANSPLTTIDGQHRILGVHLEIEQISNAMAKIDRDISRARTKDRTNKLKATRKEMEERLEKLQHEYVGIDIYVEPDAVAARQMFVDVADNARGISSALRSRFDASKVANRTLDNVSMHPLLVDSIDMEQDRMTPKNPNLLGAKHVADITRAVQVGVAGRIGRKREHELSDREVIASTLNFLDVLVGAFKDLAAVAESDLQPPELRAKSLLGSVGMLRVLAGAYHDLKEQGASDEDITAYFAKLESWMKAPVHTRSPWRKTDVSHDFEPNGSAPIMRTQNLHHLTAAIVEWFTNPPSNL